tara:strand:+ start:370 stop:549 length:180 start_codon:yes stop_codon:yes gene_type:complete
MKTITTEKLLETIQTEVRKIDYKIKVNSSLNRNDLAKLDSQKQILWTLAEKFESEIFNK